MYSTKAALCAFPVRGAVTVMSAAARTPTVHEGHPYRYHFAEQLLIETRLIIICLCWADYLLAVFLHVVLPLAAAVAQVPVRHVAVARRVPAVAQLAEMAAAAAVRSLEAGEAGLPVAAARGVARPGGASAV